MVSGGFSQWVMTKTGVPYGGSSPQKPRQSSCDHGPGPEWYILRPMMSAPNPAPHAAAMDSLGLGTKVVPPAWKSGRQTCARPNQGTISCCAVPNGASNDWSSPVAKPSSVTTKL